MTDRPGWALWATGAAILAGPAAIVAVLLLHGDPGGSTAGAQPTPTPSPSTIFRNGNTYAARQTVINAASVDPNDPRLVYAFVTDASNASDPNCRGQYPTVAVVRADATSVTLGASDYVETPTESRSAGAYVCTYALDRPVRLQVRLSTPLGDRVLRDELFDRRIPRVDPLTRCDPAGECLSQPAIPTAPRSSP